MQLPTRPGLWPSVPMPTQTPIFQPIDIPVIPGEVLPTFLGYPILDLRRYGNVGTSDDTAAWTRVMATAVNLGGGVITVPTGTTIIDTITVNASVSITIQGNGSGATRILSKAAGRTTGAAFNFTGCSVTFRRVTLDGNGPNQAAFPSDLDIIAFDGTSGNFTMEDDVVVTQQKRYVFFGTNINHTIRASFKPVNLGEPGGAGNVAGAFYVRSAQTGQVIFHDIDAYDQPVPAVQGSAPFLIQLIGSSHGTGGPGGGGGGNMVAGLPGVTLVGGGGSTFSPSDAGTPIRVGGAGVAGADLLTTILAYVDPLHATLSANAGTTVNGAIVDWNNTNDFHSEIYAIRARNFGNQQNVTALIDIYEWITRLDIHDISGRDSHYAVIKASNCPMMSIRNVIWKGQVFDTGAAAVAVSGNTRQPPTIYNDTNVENVCIEDWTFRHALSASGDFASGLSKRLVYHNIRAINCAGGIIVDGYQDVLFIDPLIDGCVSPLSTFGAIRISNVAGLIGVSGGIIQNGQGYGLVGDVGLKNANIRIDRTRFNNNNLGAVGASHVFFDGGAGNLGSFTMVAPEFLGTPNGAPAEVNVQNFLSAYVFGGIALAGATIAVSATTVRRFGGTFNFLQAIQAYASGLIAAGAQVAFNVNVVGAAAGDFVEVALDTPNGNIQQTGFAGAGVVTVVVRNGTVAGITPTGNVLVRVMKQ